MEWLEAMLSMLDRALNTKKKRHIAGGGYSYECLFIIRRFDSNCPIIKIRGG